MPPSKLQAHLKRLQGVMLISVCQGTFNGAPAFLWHCSTNCKLHTDEGHVCLPFLLSKAFARSFAVAAVIATRCKGCAFCRRSLLLFLCPLRPEIQRLGGAKMEGSRGTSPPPPWVRFIVGGVLPRPAAVFPLLNNCGRRRGRCFWGLLRRLQYTPQQIARRTMHSSPSCCCVCPCIVRSCGLRSP